MGRQRLLLKVDLPVDEVFAPQLTITAKVRPLAYHDVLLMSR
jgi:hypothetical protein